MQQQNECSEMLLSGSLLHWVHPLHASKSEINCSSEINNIENKNQLKKRMKCSLRS